MFYPSRHFNSIYEITPEFLKGDGVGALVLDIDNTLVGYGTEKPTPPVIEWINGMRGAGVGITVASNNGRERVERFCEGLDVFFTYKSGKPLTKCVTLSSKKFGIPKSAVGVVGDQIFTDVLTASLSGAKAYLVTPLVSPENPFIRFKRLLEKPIIRSYKKRHPDQFMEADK